MRQIFFLVLLFITTGLFAQAPSNYTNINGRYRWIAGMFDSTFHIPKGTTTSLRTGGSTNAGALFYRTTDSSVYYYTGTQWLKVAGAAGFVPYTGATQNVNLGQFGLTTKFVQFDTSSQAVTDRRLQWSNAEGTLQFGMTNGATITQRVGLEQFARVRNLQGDTIEAGDVVYVSGASGDRAAVKLADNRADSTSSKTLGVATEQILPNDVGLVGTFGVVGKLNLSAFTAGDVVYLDSIPGKLTKVKPQAPYHMVFVGVVERANAGNGLLFVNVQNGYELEELHNVRITSPVRNNAILAYDSVGRLWKDTTLNALGGITGSGTSGQVSYFNGTNSITSSPTFAFTPTSQLLVNNSVTAASAIARGINATPTLTAAANNDVLVGLDINPTFTNGAFTGVSNYAIRTQISSNNIFDAIQMRNTSTGTSNQVRIKFDNESSVTSTSGGVIFYTGNAYSGFPANSFGFWNHTANGIVAIATNNTERLRIFGGGNVFIGSSPVDGGFRLDVNGTARVQGDLTVTGTRISVNSTTFSIDASIATGILNIRNSSGSAANTTITLGGNTYFNIFQPTTSASGITSGTQNTITTPITYAWSSGTAQSNLFVLNPTINNTGTYSAIFRGFWYNPTLTSLTGTSHRAIETVSGDVVFGSTSGNVMIGTTTAGGRFTIQPDNNQVGMSISGSSLTGSNAQSLVSLSQTWNTTGNPTAFLLNITNTASGATADLMELQVGGVAQFIVGKSGTIQTTAPAGGTAKPWKLGNVAVVSPTSPDRTIEVEIDGVTYYIHAKTTNN